MADPQKQAVSTVKWSGQILADSAAKCRDELLSAFSSGDRILLDLSECSQIDVPAIQLILASSLEAASTGKKFSIDRSFSPEIQRAFELAGVNIGSLIAEKDDA